MCIKPLDEHYRFGYNNTVNETQVSFRRSNA